MTAELKSTEQTLLERFTRALARIVHEERPEALSRPVTVAELYQDIAPYRRMRELAGIELHADYEHALIRFLAGEGGHAQLDPESAAATLLVEAESVDPDLSAYRQFAACDVRLMLTPQAPRAPVVEASAAAPPPASASAPVAVPAPTAAPRASSSEQTAREAAAELVARATRGDPAKSARTPAPPSGGPPAARPAVPRRGEAATPAVRQRTAQCAFCGEALPERREVRFCPHCGGDQTARQCGACGETLEQGWRFCIACGAPAES